MALSELIDSLNDAQQQAVTSDAFRLLVLAGAGSGKTRVLVHRIAWLVQQQQILPHQILAVTFTNKAAAEMRQRIEQLLKTSTGVMWVGTFHGIAHRLLRTHWQDASLPQNFQIIDSDDQLRLIKRIMRAMQLDETRWPPKQAQGFINHCKDEGLRAAHLVDNGDPYQRQMTTIYAEYQAACDRGGMVDFAELLLRSHELWLQKPQLLAHYQQRFRHLLVDEFQDTNKIQYAWLRVLAGDQLPVTIVGDDDQSIYGWRGAQIENIRSFGADFGGAETVRLEQNYRSSATILAAANAVIANNGERLGKDLWTSGAEGEPIALFAGYNEIDEARFVAERIQQLLPQGRKRAEMAILYRSNAQSRVLEEAMLRAGIPYRIYGGHRFFERAEIKNALAYLRLLCHRDDDAAFERVVNLPPRGLGEKSLEKIRGQARQQSQSLWQASVSLLESKGLASRAAGALGQFLTMIEAFAQSTTEMQLWQQTEHVVNQSGLLDYHKNEKGDRGEARVENIQELVSATKEFELEAGPEDDRSLAAFLDHAALEAGEMQAQGDEDSVQMMTLHAAKGLEFPVVFICGLEEGLFPSARSVEDLGRMEEERRLAYVGITRAMEQLIITYAESRRIYGSENYHIPSRFIREIPPQCLQEVRAVAKITRPVASSFGASPATDDSPYRLGQGVKHPKFGEGVILACEGQGPNACLKINFPGVGEKRLVAQYARLELL